MALILETHTLPMPVTDGIVPTSSGLMHQLVLLYTDPSLGSLYEYAWQPHRKNKLSLRGDITVFGTYSLREGSPHIPPLVGLLRGEDTVSTLGPSPPR